MGALKKMTRCGSISTLFAVLIVLFGVSSSALTTFGKSNTQNQQAPQPTRAPGTSNTTSPSPLCVPPVFATWPVGRNTVQNAAKSDALESRRVEALERIVAASEKKTNLFAEYTAALQQQNRIRVATARLDGLDAYSAKFLLIEKQRLLAEIPSTATSENTEDDDELIEVGFTAM